MILHTETKQDLRFPLTVPLVSSYLFAFFTLGYFYLQSIANGLLVLQQEIFFLSFLLVGGVMLHIGLTIATTGTVKPLIPKPLVSRWNPKQAIIILVGIGLTSIWQLFINQIQITPYKAYLTPSAISIFALDNAIAEEASFGSVGVVLFLFMIKRGILGKIPGYVAASLGSALTMAIIFQQFHNTSLAYSNNPQALIFIFGLRLILTPIQIYTQSIFSGVVIHGSWNLVA